ncbi:type II toxin-antitoxin system RelE/ParE family toxin [Aeromonas veronii]|uniref:type II toxin-antitoxin system RelE/ParE family toxin n=1 Tax=Aeromonas veronii TaxID=654 RepID=UPI003B9F45F0
MIYKTKAFQSKFKKCSIGDEQLVEACREIAAGLNDGDLGDYLYKKRVAMPGQGKRGSYRTMLGAVIGEKYFFLYIFAKSDTANVSNKEKLALQELATQFIGLDQAKIEHLLETGDLIKIEEKQ